MRAHIEGTCGPGCYSCRLLTVGVAASSMPTRHPQAVGDEAREQRWNRDMPAYKRLRADGVQPQRIDGSADMEKRATDTFEVEMGMAASSKKGLHAVRSLLADVPV